MYNDIITEKSWKKLQELKRRYSFVLIGGWAVYCYARGLKSRDIDFICSYDELQKLKMSYELIKNDRLKKYEIHVGEFDIDIYVPFFSKLGIPVEHLMELTTMREGFKVLIPEALLILKQYAYKDRVGSAKGEKDRLDILAMAMTDLDIGHYRTLAQQYHLDDFLSEFRRVVQETRAVPELGVNEYAFSKIKKRLLASLG